MLIKITRKRVVFLTFFGALLTAGGVAYATIPASDGTISGCYRTQAGDAQGQLRIVEGGSNCRNNETAIQFSETGQRGATGPAGPAGPQGPKGDTGAAGATGATGATGAKGEPGTPGATGEPGAKGDTGEPGTPGAAGAPGAKGDKGDPGTPGAAGQPGATGTPGVSGYQIITNSVLIGNNGAGAVIATCPGTKKVLGGGFMAAGSIQVSQTNGPLGDNAWFVAGNRPLNGPSPDETLTAYAICANVS